MKTKYILFDVDGTILNTTEAVLATWTATLEHFTGQKPSRETLIMTLGETIGHTMSYLLPDVARTDALTYYRDYQANNCVDMIRLYEGIREVLGRLKAEGYRMAVVTNRTRATCLDYLTRLDALRFFDALVCMEDSVKHKPDAEPALNAMKLLGAQAGETVMVGDTKNDIGCATAAGVGSILVTWGRAEDDHREYKGSAPDHTAHTPEELMELLENL